MFTCLATVPVAYNTVQPVLATVLPSSSSTAQKEGICKITGSIWLYSVCI